MNVKMLNNEEKKQETHEGKETVSLGGMIEVIASSRKGDLGRGMTAPIQFFDNIEFMDPVKEFERLAEKFYVMFLMVGFSRSGKDTTASIIRSKFDIPNLVSVTTREKRPYETNGVEHWFFTKEEFDRELKEGDIIAYAKTKQTGVEYMASFRQLPVGKGCIYVINPNAIPMLVNTLKDKTVQGKPILILEVVMDVPFAELERRAIMAGDDIGKHQLRIAAEFEEFSTYINYLPVIGATNIKEISFPNSKSKCMLRHINDPSRYTDGVTDRLTMVIGVKKMLDKSASKVVSDKMKEEVLNEIDRHIDRFMFYISAAIFASESETAEEE